MTLELGNCRNCRHRPALTAQTTPLTRNRTTVAKHLESSGPATSLRWHDTSIFWRLLPPAVAAHCRMPTVSRPPQSLTLPSSVAPPWKFTITAAAAGPTRRFKFFWPPPRLRRTFHQFSAPTQLFWFFPSFYTIFFNFLRFSVFFIFGKIDHLGSLKIHRQLI